MVIFVDFKILSILLDQQLEYTKYFCLLWKQVVYQTTTRRWVCIRYPCSMFLKLFKANLKGVFIVPDIRKFLNDPLCLETKGKIQKGAWKNAVHKFLRNTKNPNY